MTFFHFGNCLALAYTPYFITYKYSGLAEYSAFWKCVQAGMMYMFTQLCKMMVLATFFPAADTVGGNFDVVGEFLKSTVDLADLVGIHMVMSWIASKGEIKFLVAGMGWATAELVMTRIFPLWVGARGVEFDWKYIQLSLDSNVSLVHHITTAALVWLWSRHDLQKTYLPVVMLALGMSCYRPLIVEVLIRSVGLGSWPLLLTKSAFTLLLSLVTMQLYLGLTQTVNSHKN
ncbi:PREDICTED: transmembrane protein 147-like [Priapulus caudatus]|uniref:BOS complex subunit TMEM147 n=1 Tax=Priapulus caudatus TaxID=37621 RepID=A0ABM1EQE3_PRICU|nr:PREDICTED: transmembrane protein 147-like [Priapulus caudatus]